MRWTSSAYMDELVSHGEVFSVVEKTSPLGGRPGTEFWLNEPQSLLICMFARTDRAAEARTEIIRVFMAWRAQQDAKPAPTPDPLGEFPAADGPLAEHMAKLATLRECRMIHGPRAAARLWKRLGMPQVADSAIEEMDEGRRCLAHLLAHPISSDVDRDGQPQTLRFLIECAADDHDAAQRTLRDRHQMLFVGGESEGLFVPNNLWMGRPFAGTPWDKGRHVAALRRLAGARPDRRSIGTQQRGTFIPFDLIEALPIPSASSDDGKVISLR